MSNKYNNNNNKNSESHRPFNVANDIYSNYTDTNKNSYPNEYNTYQENIYDMYPETQFFEENPPLVRTGFINCTAGENISANCINPYTSNKAYYNNDKCNTNASYQCMNQTGDNNQNNDQNNNQNNDQNNDQNNNTDNSQDNSDKHENIKEMGTTNIPNPNKEICFISIIGEIEGHNVLPPTSKATKYEHIIPQIISAELDPEVKSIMMLINTVGGDVEAGLAISELIRSVSKPTVSIVLGGGHSIGNALAVSTDYSFIAPTGTMTIHPIRTTGFIIGVPQTFRYFQKMQERITKFVVSNSNVDEKTLTKYMYDTDEIANDVGTVLNAEEVVNIGLIDEIGGFKEAVEKLRSMYNEN